MQTTAADTGIAKEFKDIFEISGVPAFRQFYNFCIFPCKYVYKGFYTAWHMIPAPTIADPRAKRRMYYLNLSKADRKSTRLNSSHTVPSRMPSSA